MKICAFEYCSIVILLGGATCGVADRAEVRGWGYNQYGQAYGSPGMENVEYVAVAAGGDSTVAVTTNGTLMGWGLNDYGQIDCPPWTNFTSIVVGNSFSLALSNNYVIGWGDNGQGQLDAPNNQQFVALAAGGEHALGQTEDGRVIAWGNNSGGQTNVPPGEQFKIVSAGQSHSVGIRTDGSLLAWGGSTDGQTNCPPGNNYVGVVAGGYHNVALRGNGALVAWGDNTAGQTNCPPGSDYVAIAAGYYHSMALRADGSIMCWGNNGDGQSDAPEGYLFAGIAAGYSHSVALKVPGLTCRFSADRVVGLHTLPVQFSGQTSSTNVPNIYFAWDFQNDGVLDAQGFGVSAPSYLYTTGVYSVLLFTSNLVGESALYFRTNFITVNARGVAADFSANVLTGAAPLSVQFSDQSLFTPQYWRWDFDDDGTVDSSERNPLYTFATAGLYRVRLDVSNNFGAGSGASHDALTRTNYILAQLAVSTSVKQLLITLSNDYARTILSWSNAPTVTVLAQTNQYYQAAGPWFALATGASSPYVHQDAGNYWACYYRVVNGTSTSAYDVGLFAIRINASAASPSTPVNAWISTPLQFMNGAEFLTLNEVFTNALTPGTATTGDALAQQLSYGATPVDSIYRTTLGGFSGTDARTNFYYRKGYMLKIRNPRNPLTVRMVGMVATNAVIVGPLNRSAGSAAWVGSHYPAWQSLNGSGLTNGFMLPGSVASGDAVAQQLSYGATPVDSIYRPAGFSGTDARTNFWPGKMHMLKFRNTQTATNWIVTRPQ